MLKEKKDILLSFVGGFIPSGTTWLIIDSHPFYSFLLKILSALIVGAAGGLAGMVMKDLYKQHLQKYFIKKSK